MTRSAADRPIVVGHQGSSEAVTAGTLDAYRAAIAAGVGMVEVDVRLSRDGVLLAAHDESVDGRLIADSTAGDILSSSQGNITAVATIVELAHAARVPIMLDLKDIGCEGTLVELAMSILDSSEFVISTLEDVSVAEIARSYPRVRVGLSLGRDAPPNRIRTRLSELFPLPRARACGADFLSVNHQLAALGVIRQAHRAGIPTFVWTVDDAAKMPRWLCDPRIEGLITNKPQTALKLVETFDCDQRR